VTPCPPASTPSPAASNSFETSRFRLVSPGRPADSLRCASSTKASTFYRQLYAFIARCRTVTAPFNHGTAKLTTQSLKKTHLGKLRAFRALQTFTAPGIPAIVSDTLVTVSGRDIYVIEAVGIKKAPSKPALPTVALRLIARVRA
jgi:hypothetical protein